MKILSQLKRIHCLPLDSTRRGLFNNHKCTYLLDTVIFLLLLPNFSWFVEIFRIAQFLKSAFLKHPQTQKPPNSYAR